MIFNHSEKIRAVVFDFDGTLAELRIDFNEMKHRLILLAEEYRLPNTAPSALPVLEWLQKTVRYNSFSATSEFQRKAEAFILETELKAAREAKLFSFTRPLFVTLRQRFVKTAIITRNCEQAVRIVFPDLEDYCDCLLTRDHVPRVKPDPDHLLRAVQQLSATPETALMVGDHPIDIETGNRAGVLAAGVWSGNASRASLLQSGARWTAPDCEALLSLLTDQSLIF